MCLHTYRPSWRYKLTVKWRIWERLLRKASTSFFVLFFLASGLSHSRKPFLSQSYATFFYLADMLVLQPWTCALSPWLLARPMILLHPRFGRGSSFLHQTMTRTRNKYLEKNKLNKKNILTQLMKSTKKWYQVKKILHKLPASRILTIFCNFIISIHALPSLSSAIKYQQYIHVRSWQWKLHDSLYKFW